MGVKKIKELKACEEAKYQNIGLDYLVMYAMGELEKMNINLSLEK